MNSLILMTVSRSVFYLAFLYGLHLLFRGHNAPGGGFIAGLVVVCVLVLQGLAFGMEQLKTLLPLRMAKLIALSLLLAGLTGMGAVLLGLPFLTSGIFHLHVPGWGETEVLSSLFFDMGVFGVVVGSVMFIFEEMGE